MNKRKTKYKKKIVNYFIILSMHTYTHIHPLSYYNIILFFFLFLFYIFHFALTSTLCVEMSARKMFKIFCRYHFQRDKAIKGYKKNKNKMKNYIQNEWKKRRGKHWKNEEEMIIHFIVMMTK